jgi:cobalt-zinc-cadmium efflux system outer membrane protein
MKCAGFLCVAALAAWIASANADTDSLTVTRVIELARNRAPAVLLAQSRVEDARGRLEAVDVLSTENPTIEGVAGTDDRFERRTQWELTVPFDPGWTRWSRKRVARAELQREEYYRTDTTQRAMGAALQAFYRALHARDRLDIARLRLVVAERLKTAAGERHRSGDVARMDLLLAQTEQARATSEVRMGEHDLARASMNLAVVLALPPAVGWTLAGDLADRAALERERVRDLARADVLAAERELRAADAERTLARTTALPKVAFRLNYDHESGVAVARPGLALTVPLFNAGYGERVAARERTERAKIELDARRAAAKAEIEGTEVAYAAARSAAEELGRSGIPQGQEVSVMAEEGYRAGKINLTALLQIRREALDTQREYTDRLLDAALAAIDRAVASGAWR